jgi:hypothetical protein
MGPAWSRQSTLGIPSGGYRVNFVWEEAARDKKWKVMDRWGWEECYSGLEDPIWVDELEEGVGLSTRVDEVRSSRSWDEKSNSKEIRSKKPKKTKMYGSYLKQTKYTWNARLADTKSISFEEAARRLWIEEIEKNETWDNQIVKG